MRVPATRAGELEAMMLGSTIAELDNGVLIDAMAAPEGAAVVVGAALRRRRHEGRAVTAIGHPRRTGVSRLADDPATVTPLSVEQSNSSVLVGGGRLIAKLVRRLAAGANPDVELPRHLRRQGVDHVPGVAATLDLEIAGESELTTALVVHDAIPNESDLWTWTQDVLTRDVERLVAEPDSTSEDVSLSVLVDLLARRTAQMHQGLAGGAPGFEPQAFTLLWQRSILQSLRGSLGATQRLLRRRLGELSVEAAALATTIIDHGDRLLVSFDGLRTRQLDARRIRVHGDYHLGQVLWTGHDVVIIDFEGEPGQSMGARAIKRSPLADVAGMLRSIDYAGRVAIATSEQRGRSSAAHRPRLEAGRRRRTKAAQEQFVRTYVDSMTGPDATITDLLPAADEDARLVLDAYVLLKALYEVRYELGARPDWVGWPLAAIAEMIAARAT